MEKIKTNQKLTKEKMDLIVQLYRSTNSLNQTRLILEKDYHIKLAYQKIRKLMITLGEYENEISRKIGVLYRQGMSPQEIGETFGMSAVSVNGYLPYQSGIFCLEPENTVKEHNHEMKSSQEIYIKEGPLTLENLWDTIVAHQGEIFLTKKNLPFSYTIKGGEMYTDRRERSITRSTFEAAFKKIQNSPETVTGPKSLNVFGAPYVWAVLMGIGVPGR